MGIIDNIASGQGAFQTNKIAFQSGLAIAKKGEWVVYHVGSLAFDRHVHPGMGGDQLARCADIGNVADAAMAEYKAGRCALVQQRTGNIICETEAGLVHEFRYIAIKQR